MAKTRAGNGYGNVVTMTGEACMSALSSRDFVQSIGVNVHLSYMNTPYANVGIVESSLAYLGVSSVRDHMPIAAWGQNYVTPYVQMAADGYRFDFILTVYTDPYRGYVTPAADLSTVSSMVH